MAKKKSWISPTAFEVTEYGPPNCTVDRAVKTDDLLMIRGNHVKRAEPGDIILGMAANDYANNRVKVKRCSGWSKISDTVPPGCLGVWNHDEIID